MTSEQIVKAKLKFLQFDTDIFGFGCAELVLADVIPSCQDVNGLLKKAQDNGIVHICAKIPAERVEAVNIVENCGFRLMVNSLDLVKDKLKSMDSRNLSIHEAALNHEERIKEITLNAFSDSTRFHFEKMFLPDRVKLLYQRWIENLLSDPSVVIIVYLIDDVVAGYLTAAFDPHKGNAHIGLFAVDTRNRSQGIGGLLLKELEIRIQDHVHSLKVRTESINYPALRTYQHAGFKMCRSWNVFHWSSP